MIVLVISKIPVELLLLIYSTLDLLCYSYYYNILMFKLLFKSNKRTTPICQHCIVLGWLQKTNFLLLSNILFITKYLQNDLHHLSCNLSKLVILACYCIEWIWSLLLNIRRLAWMFQSLAFTKLPFVSRSEVTESIKQQHLQKSSLSLVTKCAVYFALSFCLCFNHRVS